jgi:hypothetical protein
MFEFTLSSRSRAKVKNEWSYTSTALCVFIAWRGKNFNFVCVQCIQALRLEGKRIEFWSPEEG